VLLALLIAATDAQAEVRAKDIGGFSGIEDTVVSGYGVVTGLARTGDSTKNLAAVEILLKQANVQGYTMEGLSSRNVALVRVEATIPSDSRKGGRVDVTISSVGDATSLMGGQLTVTPLASLTNELVATAQGSLVVGGYSASGGGDSSTKNHTTTGTISDGALLIIDGPASDLAGRTLQEFIVDEPDWTTVSNLADAINTDFGADIAIPVSQSTVEILVPEDYAGRFPWFAAKIEAVNLEVDKRAIVVVNERTGTVVMGAGVRIDDVAIAHGGLTIEVDNRVEAVQPDLLSLGQTAIIQNGAIEVREADGELSVVGGTTIGDLVSALNAMGVNPRDLIVILQAIEASGSLHADLKIQ